MPGLTGELRAATCTFASGELDVMLAERERVTLVREGSQVAVRTSDAQPCATVELAQLDTISVAGTATRDVVVVDLLGGPLDGGTELEAGIAETELFVDLSSGGRDRLVVRLPTAGGFVVLGDSGIALNDDDDADLLFAGVEEFVFAGRKGPDVLSATGGRGTGGITGSRVTFRGGAGDDALVGGNSGDVLHGGAGRDDISGGGGNDVLIGGADSDRLLGGRGNDLFVQGSDPDGSDVIFGQGGRDTADYSARSGPVVVSIGVGADDGAVGSVERDRVASDIEVVKGGFADDVLRTPPRSTAPYELIGGPGADIIFGGEGNDLLNGGPGTDTVSFTRSRGAVAVDLRRGTARGMGTDRVHGFEDVVGSRFGDLLLGNRLDNVLDGWRGADELHGRSGDDTLIGGRGNDALQGDGGRDALEGGGGDDLLLGGAATDTLEGGPGRDGCADRADTRRSCEFAL